MGPASPELNTLVQAGPLETAITPHHTAITSSLVLKCRNLITSRGMCYVEDVYHTKCNHWAAERRTYHKCPAANVPGYRTECFNRKRCGSAQDDSWCKRCRFDVDKEKGTWLSVFRDKDTQKMAIIVRRSNRKLSALPPPMDSIFTRVLPSTPCLKMSTKMDARDTADGNELWHRKMFEIKDQLWSRMR